MPLFHAAAFYASLALFGAWAAALSVLCFLLGWLPESAGAQAAFQRLVQRSFWAVGQFLLLKPTRVGSTTSTGVDQLTPPLVERE